MESYSNSLVAKAKTEMAEYSNSLVAKIENTGEEVITKLRTSATQLNTDVNNLQSASDSMVQALTNEVDAIKKSFVKFGTNIKESAKGIVGSAVIIRDEFKEAITQVNVPLANVKEYARRCRDDNPIFLPYNIFMMINWSFLYGLL